MIPCNEINQKANELLVKFKKCQPLSSQDKVDLINLIIAINDCSGGEGGGIYQDNINRIFTVSISDIGAESFDDNIPLLLAIYINEQNIIINEIDIAYFEVFDSSNKEIYVLKDIGKGLLEVTPNDLFKIEDIGPKTYIDDNNVSEIKTWSSYYISQLLNVDRFVTRGTISAIDNEVTLSVGYKWILSQLEFENTSEWSHTISLASEGMLRRDIIVATTDNTFEVIEGDESSTNPITPQTPINTLLVTIIPVYDEGIGQPIEPTPPTDHLFQNDITVSLTNNKTLGKYTNGQTIPAQGKTAEEVIRDIAIEYLSPSFTSFVMQGQANVLEVGAAASGNKNFAFSFQYPENVLDNTINIIDVTASNTIATNLPKTSPQNVNIGTVSKSSIGTNQWRATATNSMSQQIQSSLHTITWYFRCFAGSVSDFPTNGNALRTALLGNSVISNSNSMTFNTGTTNRRFIIAVPSHKTLVEAKNMGTNENLPFTLSSTITTVPDASNTLRNYKVYTLENAVPFSSNYTINITLS